MFLDTSGLLGYLNAAETAHDDAVVYFDNAPYRASHNYVIAELVPLARARGIARSTALAFVERLQTDGSVDITYIDRGLHTEALDLLMNRLDKDWSLCDAASFVLMDQLGITEALTTDHHFEQAGFIKLLTA